MRGFEINVKGVGVAYAEPSGTHNRILIGWGGSRGASEQVYHQKYVIQLTYDYEGWEFMNLNEATSYEKHLLSFVEAILNTPELCEKLESWRKNAVRRLIVSVPRLHAEYVVAEQRLEVLSSVKF